MILDIVEKKTQRLGRSLYEIYKSEFSRAVSYQSLEHLIEIGKIRVNGQVKSKDYIIRNSDRIGHAKHRHEIPVLGDRIKILQDNENYLVVDKPCMLQYKLSLKINHYGLEITVVRWHRLDSHASMWQVSFQLTKYDLGQRIRLCESSK